MHQSVRITSAPRLLQAGLTLKCSATSHDSNAENSSEVATPQKMRPTNRMLKLLKCLVKQPNT